MDMGIATVLPRT